MPREPILTLTRDGFFLEDYFRETFDISAIRLSGYAMKRHLPKRRVDWPAGDWCHFLFCHFNLFILRVPSDAWWLHSTVWRCWQRLVTRQGHLAIIFHLRKHSCQRLEIVHGTKINNKNAKRRKFEWPAIQCMINPINKKVNKIGEPLPDRLISYFLCVSFFFSAPSSLMS